MKKKYIMSEEHKRKIGLANKGSNHGLWVGDKITYKALHSWVARNYGKSPICEKCGENKKRVDWANISGEYKRDRSDWQRLCRKCHYAYDWGGFAGNPNAKITKEQLLIIKSTPKKYGVVNKLAKQFGVNRHTISRYFK